MKGRHFDEPGNPDQPDQPYGCNCTGTTPGPLPSSAQYICYDWRLGPKTLPKYLPLSSELSSYDRFDGLTPGEFIKTWWDPELNPPYGSFRYPGDVTPGDQGFSIDINGKPISGFVELPPNTYLDRFGKETGLFRTLYLCERLLAANTNRHVFILRGYAIFPTIPSAFESQ